MAKSPKKKPKIREDVNTTAFRTLVEATGQAPKTLDSEARKDPATVSLGKKGAAKDGNARVATMTKEKRSDAPKKPPRLIGGNDPLAVNDLLGQLPTQFSPQR